MVWFKNRTPALNARGLGFNFKHYKRQIKTKKNWHKRPAGWKGSLEQSSRGKAVKLLPSECDSSGDDTHPCDGHSHSKPIFKNIFLTKIFITFHSFPRSSVLVRISIAVMKQHDQKQLGEKRVYLYTSISQFIPEGRQELMRRPWRVLLTGLLLMAYSAWFLIEPRTSSPGMAPPTVSWALSHQ